MTRTSFVEVQGTAEGMAFTRNELDTLVGLAEVGVGELRQPPCRPQCWPRRPRDDGGSGWRSRPPTPTRQGGRLIPDTFLHIPTMGAHLVGIRDQVLPVEEQRLTRITVAFDCCMTWMRSSSPPPEHRSAYPDRAYLL